MWRQFDTSALDSTGADNRAETEILDQYPAHSLDSDDVFAAQGDVGHRLVALPFSRPRSSAVNTTDSHHLQLYLKRTRI